MPLIEPGAKAPAFALKDQEGQLHRLSDYAGRSVILYFYPKDDTPGCTQESCEFQASLPQMAKTQGGRTGYQYSRREEQGQVREETRPDVSSASRRGPRGRREVRRVAEEDALRPLVHGNRSNDVSHRPGRQGDPAVGQGQGRWTRGGSRCGTRLAVLVSVTVAAGGSPFLSRSRAFSTSR